MQKNDLVVKVAVIMGICVIAYFLIVLPYLNRGEGDPRYVFVEVTFNDTINHSLIQLQDKDIMNIRGLDVRQKNGKIAEIIFRYSDGPPEIKVQDFNQKFGSPADDLSPRKYLEYKGIYYYAEQRIP